jgi:hypothetical protein
VEASEQDQSRHHYGRHATRKRGIQYAVAYRFDHDRLGELDRLVKAGR